MRPTSKAVACIASTFVLSGVAEAQDASGASNRGAFLHGWEGEVNLTISPVFGQNSPVSLDRDIFDESGGELPKAALTRKPESRAQLKALATECEKMASELDRPDRPATL